MLQDEPLNLSSGLGESFLLHVVALFDAPFQQEALIGFKEHQLVHFLQPLLPEQQHIPWGYLLAIKELSGCLRWRNCRISLTGVGLLCPETSGPSESPSVCSSVGPSALMRTSDDLMPHSPEPGEEWELEQRHDDLTLQCIIVEQTYPTFDLSWMTPASLSVSSWRLIRFSTLSTSTPKPWPCSRRI